ncbi:MAG: MBL fold metallo-hydrolase [Gemmatimonadales bacterium]|jgi:glyoxylase-like metal-dependent hydrolase (beta-lactamase superfamily II)|nr:MBL fold metallo-hydrolase [Gemmatimonadales bacterium]MBT3775510.1 MBL fold metallo-hydrolase [Gemmatimonadales bacterium]MBT3957375.1 MBL fold metallo-hydrolase [Gemmatimonadales bacterium]MBT4436117.1 MBL fold metallo-hydrolase [Gemmatimonadales bacterium]MBT4914489.1 MBL fold metallo-hydrolase [Gemmatimonadales bacterium]
MDVRTFTGGGFGENAYLVACSETNHAVVVDPGGAAHDIVAALHGSDLKLDAILLTHAHLDHVEGVDDVRAFAPEVPIWLHRDDYELYMALPWQASLFGLTAKDQPAPTHELEHGQRYTFGDCAFDVRFTPGHSPGHVIFVAVGEPLALSGDVVFMGSIGRTDLPGGNFQTLMKSIREEVLTLPDDTVLHSGHGPATTVGHERVGNPFLVPHYRGETA